MGFSVIEPGPNGLAEVQYGGTPLSAGTYPLTLNLTDDNGAILTQQFNLTITSAPIVVQTDSLPAGAVGQPYSAAIQFTFVSDGKNEPQGVTVTGLPSGVTMGTPTYAWTSDYGGYYN